jgi:chromosome segregation ATPase
MSNYDEEIVNSSKVDEEIDAISNSLKECNERKVKINEKLDSVKKDRKNLFMNFFTSLRPILQKTYQLLTENNDGVSGKVDLYL